MKLVVTIDTEEDNWGNFADRNYTTENIEMIPQLQELFDDFNVKPTYLITYPVATDDRSAGILREISEANKCEIGTHCHPWNTPPFEEEKNERNSMLCNLPPILQYEKIKILHNKIRDRFGIEPISFRAGRWGYDQQVAKNLHRLGYKIDTSISSYTDWSPYHGPDFSKISPRPYWLSVDNIFSGNSNGQLLEVPATIAFLQGNFKLANRIHNILSRKPMNKMKFIGVLDRFKLLNKVWLSPEMNESTEMIELTKCFQRKGYELVNFFFHSPSLKYGLTPFVKTGGEQKEFLRKIREYLAFIKDVEIEPIKLSDCLNT